MAVMVGWMSLAAVRGQRIGDQLSASLQQCGEGRQARSAHVAVASSPADGRSTASVGSPTATTGQPHEAATSVPIEPVDDGVDDEVEGAPVFDDASPEALLEMSDAASGSTPHVEHLRTPRLAAEDGLPFEEVPGACFGPCVREAAIELRGTTATHQDELAGDSRAVRQVADEQVCRTLPREGTIDVAVGLEGARDEATAHGRLDEDVVEDRQVFCVALPDRAAALAGAVDVAAA